MPNTFSPGQIPKNIPGWQYEAFRALGNAAAAHSAGFAAILRGEMPDGSGLLLPAPDLSQYLYLPGRTGGQIVHGIDGTAPAVTFDTIASGLSTVGGIGYPYIRFSHATTTKVDIVPLLNNDGTVDVAFNLYAAGLLFLDASNTTAGLRFAFSTVNTFIQCGRVQSDGSVANKNMQFGGMNAEGGAALGFIFNTCAFLSSGTGADLVSRVGINVNPSANTGTGAGAQPVFITMAGIAYGTQYDKAFVAITGLTHPATDTADARVPFFDLKTGTSLSGDSIFSIDRWGRLLIRNPGNSAISSCIDGNAYSFRVSDGQDSSTAHQLIAASGQNRWSDGAAKATTSFQIGANWAGTGMWSVIESGNRASTSDGLPFDRLGISSLLTMISDAASTAGGSLTPPTAILHVRGTVADATVILKVATARSGQSGDLQEWVDYLGTVLASVDCLGHFLINVPSGATNFLRIYNTTAASFIFNVTLGTADAGLVQIGRASDGAYWQMRGGSSPAFEDSAGVLLLKLNEKTADWTDAIAGEELRLGDSHAGSGRVAMLLGQGGTSLDRLGVSSNYIVFTRGNTTVLPAPASVGGAPEIVRIYNGTTFGHNAAALLRIESLRAGQTGNLTTWINQAGTIAAVNKDCIFVGNGSLLTNLPVPTVFPSITINVASAAASFLTINNTTTSKVIFNITQGASTSYAALVQIGRSDDGSYWQLRGGPQAQIEDSGGNILVNYLRASTGTMFVDAKSGVLHRLGAVLGSARNVCFQGSGGTQLDRLVVQSAYTQFTPEGTLASIVAPVGTEIVRVVTTPTAGTDGSILLRLDTTRTGHTANLVNIVSAVTGSATFNVNNKCFLTASLLSTVSFFVDTTDVTKKVAFALAGITTGTTRTLTVQDKNGTIALLPDTYTLPYVGVTGTYAILTTDYIVNCTANTFTVTLPTAASIAGRLYIVKNRGVGVITVAATGAETIDGAVTATLAAGVSIAVASDGTNWIIT